MAHHDRGRPTSWLAAIIIMAGFAVGGLGLVLGHWWLFWVGIGVCVVGGIVAIVVDLVSDVELDPIHQDNAEPFTSLIRHTVVSESPDRMSPRLVGEGPDVRPLTDEDDEPGEPGEPDRTGSTAVGSDEATGDDVDAADAADDDADDAVAGAERSTKAGRGRS